MVQDVVSSSFGVEMVVIVVAVIVEVDLRW